MRHPLKLHPDYVCPPVTGIEVEVSRLEGGLELRYLVSGDMAGLRLPAPREAARGDELWHHTCFEVFARTPGDAGYCELNFAPSRAWAAYRFGSHRSGREDADVPPPRIESRSDACTYELLASCVLDLPSQVPWRLAISTIIEETDGRKSYWALAHPQGKADFHDEAGFILQLPAVA